MDTTRLQQITDLLSAALELEPDERATFLEKASAGDLALQREVESLIASLEQSSSLTEDRDFNGTD